jgi:hypothetical protein
MSYLNNYRINFWGGISTNVCTSNNDDVGHFFADPVSAMLSPELAKMTDEEAFNTLKGAPGWNFYGDYVTKFQKANISSYGTPGNIQDSDTSLVGQGVYLLGSLDPKTKSKTPIGSPIMIDMDSTGTSCTQMIVGGLQIGGNDNPLLRINENTLGYTRSLQTITKNNGGFQVKSINGYQFGVANTNWKLSFEYSDDWEYDTSNPEIMKLVDAAKAANGITIVFTTFEVILGYSRADIIKQYESGLGTMNPVLGYTIGSIGVWEKGEAKTCLPGRLLKAVDSTFVGADTYVELDEEQGMVHLNMSSTFIKPKVRDVREDINTISPTVDPKDLYLGVKSGKTATSLVSIPYDPNTYHTIGGLISVAVDAETMAALKNADLVLVQKSTGNVLAQEQTYRVVSDSRGIYISPTESYEAAMQVTKWGQPITEDLPVSVTFSDSGQLSATYGQYTGMNVGVSDQHGNPITFTSKGLGVYKGETTLKAADGGYFGLVFGWMQGGIKQINIYIDGVDVANYYMVVRTYPNDDYSQIKADVKYSWDFIYENILRYYYIIFPAMQMRFPLNDQTMVTQIMTQPILDRISSEYADTTLRMPMTLDMSPGKIKLLTEFLDPKQRPSS